MKLCIQIIRRSVESSLLAQDSNRHLPTQIGSFAAATSLQDLAIYMAPHSSCQCSEGQHFSVNTCEQSRMQSKAFQSLAPICLADMFPQWSLALVVVSSTRSSQAVTHLSIMLAQCCLTSVFSVWCFQNGTGH